jgi:hypothetical protein
MAKEPATAENRGALATADDFRRILGTLDEEKLLDVVESRPQESAQDDKWSFCLAAGTLWPANQERQ